MVPKTEKNKNVPPPWYLEAYEIQALSFMRDTRTTRSKGTYHSA